MLPYLLLALVLAGALFFVVLRAWYRQRELKAWQELAARYPASTGAYDGTRFAYPDAEGAAVVGEEGFRAQPSAHLEPIDVPWSKVRSVRSGSEGGLNVHLPGGVVILPGVASATVAEIIERRARRRRASAA